MSKTTTLYLTAADAMMLPDGFGVGSWLRIGDELCEVVLWNRALHKVVLKRPQPDG